MSMLNDMNHVIAIRLHHATKETRLIPTTSLSDMVLMHHECQTCHSLHGSKWIPDGKLFGSKNDSLNNKHLEYFYKRHRLDVEVKGLYFIIDACLRSSIEACAQDLVVFAIKQAKPAFSTLGDGYMGLSTGNGFDNAMESSLLYQMYDSGMIKSKVFGVHTHMFNSTQDPS